MNGEISIPTSGLEGRWLVRTQYIQVGSSSFLGNTVSSTINFVPDPVSGYTPVGIVGYGTQNENANGVKPSDSSGKIYQSNSWVMPIRVFYDPNTKKGSIQIRNMSNTGSDATKNKEGGAYLMCFVVVQILYIKDSGAFVPEPTDPVNVSTNVNLNYGLKCAIVTYGRMCEIYINEKTTAKVPANSIIGTIPRPSAGIFIPNVSGTSFLYASNTDGILKNFGELASGAQVRCAFTYITAS